MSMEVRATLCKSDSSVRVLNMIEQDNWLSYGAVATAAAVLAAMWICKDAIAASIDVPEPLKEWTRNRWLRLRGIEEYVGRHRCHAT